MIVWFLPLREDPLGAAIPLIELLDFDIVMVDLRARAAHLVTALCCNWEKAVGVHEFKFADVLLEVRFLFLGCLGFWIFLGLVSFLIITKLALFHADSNLLITFCFI